MVQQKALATFWNVIIQAPSTFSLTDRVPRPHRAGLHGLAVAHHAAHLAPAAFHPAPAAVFDAGRLCGDRVDVQVVMAVDQAPPGVLGVPRVVHGHRSLGNRIERIFVHTKRNGNLFDYQEAMVRKITLELNGYDNVIYEIQNEPWSDQQGAIFLLNKTNIRLMNTPNIKFTTKPAVIVFITDSSSLAPRY